MFFELSVAVHVSSQIDVGQLHPDFAKHCRLLDYAAAVCFVAPGIAGTENERYPLVLAEPAQQGIRGRSRGEKTIGKVSCCQHKRGAHWTWVGDLGNCMERETGIEPATFSLGS